MTEICLRRCFFVEITICIGSSCHLHGSRDVIQVLEKLVTAHGLTDKVELKGSLTPADVPSFFKNEILEKLA